MCKGLSTLQGSGVRVRVRTFWPLSRVRGFPGVSQGFYFSKIKVQIEFKQCWIGENFIQRGLTTFATLSIVQNTLNLSYFINNLLKTMCTVINKLAFQSYLYIYLLSIKLEQLFGPNPCPNPAGVSYPCGSALRSTHNTLFISSFDRCFYFYCSFCFTQISLLKIKGTRSEEWTGNCGLDKTAFKLRLLQFWRNGIQGWSLSRAPSFHIWTFIFVCLLLYLSFGRPSSAWSFSWRLDSRVEHRCWGGLHWGQQWRSEIDLSPRCQFPESFPTRRIRRERMEVKSYL